MQRKVLPLIAALLFSAIPSVQAATAQVGFSPEGTAQVLVLDVIGANRENGENRTLRG